MRGSLTCERNHEGFAYFYCKRNETGRQRPLDVLRSFVRQLSTTAYEQESIHENLLKLHQECREHSRIPNLANCKELIKDYVATYPTSTLILDALDECDEGTRHELLTFFDELISHSSKPVKFFISSRPDVDITKCLSSRSNIGITVTDNQSDIRKYIAIEMIKHVCWERFSMTLQYKIIDKLEEKSEGMYAITLLVIKFSSTDYSQGFSGLFFRCSNF